MDWPTDRQIEAWYPLMFRTALRMTGSHDTASDLTQQAFTKALAAWGSYNGACLPITWLNRILVNCVRDWGRRRAVRTAEPLEPWTLGLAVSTPEAEASLEQREQVEAVRSAIAALPRPQREAFVATVVDGYSYAEASEMLSVPRGTIGRRVHDARRTIRDAMRKTFAEIRP